MDIKQLLTRLTTEEKAALVAGRDFMFTNPVPGSGISSLRMSDGPHGLRVQDEGGDNGVTGSSPATAFPTAATVACGWEFVGKKLDEVVARISELLEELGYVAKEKHQTMQMHVVTESEKLREAVEQTVESGVAVLKAHCDMAFEIAEAVQHETLVQAVLYTNPGMDEEEVRAMSDTELIRIYKSAMLEKAEFALCYLEDQFYQMKEMEFKFRYYEEMRGVLEGVNQIILAAYDIPLGILRTGVEHLTELQADLYDVTFDDVIIIVNGQNVFDAATQFVIDAIQSAIDSLNNTIDQLDDYRQKYIEASDADKLLTDVQNAINDAKDGFFAEFEDEFGGAISKAKERISEYKAALAGAGE